MENSKPDSPEPDRKKFTEQLKKAFALRHVAGMIAGGIGGFLYFHFTKCADGACSLKANPLFYTFLGILLGYLIGDLFKKKKQS